MGRRVSYQECGEGRPALKRDLIAVALHWVALSVVGELIVALYEPFPLVASEEGHIVDEAFRVLSIMAVPVFAMVVATIGYSVIRFRSRGEPQGDGPPIRSHNVVVATWIGVTTALTVVMIIFPGTTGLLELRALAKDEDLVVHVQGSRWFWQVTYPEHDITVFSPANEMVLPADRRVKFEVTATDVLHSFWVPAFRIKIDAVPGRMTTTYATPNVTGSRDDDLGFRLVCAELCGVGHSIMNMPVRVVAPEEFDAWVAQKITAR